MQTLRLILRRVLTLCEIDPCAFNNLIALSAWYYSSLIFPHILSSGQWVQPSSLKCPTLTSPMTTVSRTKTHPSLIPKPTPNRTPHPIFPRQTAWSWRNASHRHQLGPTRFRPRLEVSILRFMSAMWSRRRVCLFSSQRRILMVLTGGLQRCWHLYYFSSTVNQSIYQWINQSINHYCLLLLVYLIWIKKTTRLTAFKFTKFLLSNIQVDQSINHSINRSFNRSINQSINQSLLLITIGLFNLNKNKKKHKVDSIQIYKVFTE